MRRAWNFLKISKNRAILAWLGGGIAVAASGILTVLSLFWPPDEQPSPGGPAIHVEASEGAIAIGGDVKGSEVRAGAPTRPISEAVR